MRTQKWGGGKLVSNQVMGFKIHLNFPLQALVKADTRIILLMSGFPEGGDYLSSVSPVRCAPV